MQQGDEDVVLQDLTPKATQALADFERCYPRNEAMARAYLSGQHTMLAIAEHFGVHYSTVSRRVRQYESASGR